ncbi:MAG: DeoR/GlpR family DNA-binding transcription regulator [Solirubrobacteraceae bacterium]
MQQSQRLSKILERLSSDGSIGVGEIARELEVSPATVRRDLQLLEGQRLLGRTHGGAVPQGVLYELPLRYKSTRQAQEKKRIAAEAASRVADGWAIGLTGGTTTTEVARALVDRPHLTVVTNALNIAAEIAVRPNLKLVVTGGVARPESYELVGPIAEESLEGLNLDVVFLSVDGISSRAHFTTHHELEAKTNRALIARANRVCVVADASKLGKVAFARICDLDDVSELITDSAADSAEVAALEELGLQITTV